MTGNNTISWCICHSDKIIQSMICFLSDSEVLSIQVYNYFWSHIKLAEFCFSINSQCNNMGLLTLTRFCKFLAWAYSFHLLTCLSNVLKHSLISGYSCHKDRNTPLSCYCPMFLSYWNLGKEYTIFPLNPCPMLNGHLHFILWTYWFYHVLLFTIFL